MNRCVALGCFFLAMTFGVAGVAYLVLPKAVTEVRMGLPVFSGVEPLVLAQRQGYYAANGARVRLQRFTSLYDSKRAFTDGKIDVTTMTIFDAILLADQGAPFKIVLVVDTTRGSNAIVAQKGLATVKDLRGKRVGVTAGAALHSLLLAALHQNGMRESDVVIINHPPDRLADLLLAGQLDAASLVDPFLAQALRKNVGQVVFDSRDVPQLITDVLVVRPDLEQTHPGATDALVRGYFQALEFWKTNEPEAAAVMADSTGLSSDEFRQVLTGLVITGKKENAEAFGTNQTPGWLQGTIPQWDRILMDNGLLRRPSNLAERLDDNSVRRIGP